VLDALPLAILVVDASLRVVQANAAARAALGASAGTALGEVIPCAHGSAAPSGAGARCAGCAVGDAVRRALAGAPARARGVLLRGGPGGAPAHLLATAAPLRRGGARRAVLVLEDPDRILLDGPPVRIWAGCERVEDDDGCWYPLHRFLEDRFGPSPEALCDLCGRGAVRRAGAGAS
jgi:hypothetical protein